MARALGLTVLLGLLLGACAHEEQNEWPVRSVTELVTLGEMDHPVLGFPSVDGLAVGRDLYVLHRSAAEITVLARNGDLVRRIGERGQGPGEFTVPSAVGLRSDTLWVLDNGNRRISYFVDGRIVREQGYPTLALARGENMAAVLPLDGGAALAIVARRFESPPGDQENFFPLLRVDGVDTIQIAALRESSPFRVRIGTASVSPPAVDFPIFEVAPSGEVLVVVERPIPAGPQATIRVTRISSIGDTLWSRSLTRPAVPYTDTDWRNRLDQLFAAIEPSYTRSEYEAAAIRPEWHVPVSGLQLGQDGAIWIGLERVPGSDSIPWLKLSATGELQFEVDLPARFRLLAAEGDELWGEVRDTLDVPYLRVYQVVSPT